MQPSRQQRRLEARQSARQARHAKRDGALGFTERFAFVGDGPLVFEGEHGYEDTLAQVRALDGHEPDDGEEPEHGTCADCGADY